MKSRLLKLAGVLLASSAISLLIMASAASAAPTIGLMYTGAANVEGHQEPNESQEEWDAIQKSGAKTFRIPVQPEESSNGSNWSYYDKVFRLAAERGVTILPMLHGRPNPGSGLPTSSKKEEEEWFIWVKKAVKRYGYNGNFWAENPGVPATPASAWEVWNEPNNLSFGEIKAEAYGAFLVYTSAAIQIASQEQSGFKTGVLFGGLLIWNGGTGYQKYLADAYKVPGVSNSFTGLSIHPYEMGIPNMIGVLGSTVNGVRSYLDTLPEGKGKSLWITEIGWAVEREYAVSEAEQATLLTESFNWLKGAATADNIKSIIWYNYRDSDVAASWSFRCGLRDEVGNFRRAWFAFQEQAGSPHWPNPRVAMQANTGTLYNFTQASGGVNTGAAMKAGTSPSVGQYRGSYKMAFQGSTGNLHLYTPSGGAVNTGYAMKSGTNPSITPLEDGVVAFQADTGNLWTYESGGAIVNTGYAMAAGTSPSITVVPDLFWQHPARYPVAFQANTGNLWYYESGGSVVNTGLGMAAGTSPTIAALDSPGKRFAIAFQANTGNLWIYEPGGTVADLGYGMKSGTSPAIASLPGGKDVIVFQANTGNLYYYEPGGTVANTGYGMQAKSSPSVSAISDWPYYRKYEIAFHASSTQLWTYEPGGAIINTMLGSQAETSPSISPG